jgi:acyl carrier protein
MNVEARIKEFILQNLYFSDHNSLDDNASFLETNVVDSMGVMELVTFIESEFGVRTEPQEIVVDNFDSVSKLASFVRRKRAAAERENAPRAARTTPVPLIHR